MKKWCPTCRYSLKEFGLNSCELVDFKVCMEWNRERNMTTFRWLENNSNMNTTVIYKDADNCPTWEVCNDMARDYIEELETLNGGGEECDNGHKSKSPS